MRFRNWLPTGWKIGLAGFGLALGVITAGLGYTLEGSAPIARIEAIWRAPWRDVQRGDGALAAGDQSGARGWFDRAIQGSADTRDRLVVLELIFSACRKSQAWSLAALYSSAAHRLDPTAANDVRLGEALCGTGDFQAGDVLFEKVIHADSGGVGKTKLAPMPEWIADQARCDLADSLACENKDLDRALDLAENGIKDQIQHPGPRALLASLNDALAWVYYNRSFKMGAADILPPRRRRSVISSASIPPRAS
jgi:hypothetical protein